MDLTVTYGSPIPYGPNATTRTLDKADSAALQQASRRKRGLTVLCCRGLGPITPFKCATMFRNSVRDCIRDGGCSMGKIESKRQPMEAVDMPVGPCVVCGRTAKLNAEGVCNKASCRESSALQKMSDHIDEGSVDHIEDPLTLVTCHDPMAERVAREAEAAVEMMVGGEGQDDHIPQAGADSISAGRKDDSGKLRYDLLPPDALEELVRVYTVGAAKYAPRNWEQGISFGRVFAALMRHAWAWWRGEENDPEDGLPHMAHAAWNCMSLLSYGLRGMTGLDDRPESITKAEGAKG